MQIVIELSEKDLDNINHNDYIEDTYYTMLDAIINGTPLPKRHGDLITKEQAIELVEFYQINPQHFNFVNLIDEIKDEKPIIEADDTESEESCS